MKCVGVLAQITIYANFKQAVLNAKDAVRNQNPSDRRPKDCQKHRHSSSNARQAQFLKKSFLKRNLEGLKPETLGNRKES